jgi:cell division protein FtsB
VRKKLFIFLISSLGLYLSFNLARGAWESYQNAGRLLDSEKRLAQAQAENQSLKEELEYTKSDFFIEKEARDKLGLGKEGETVIITPPPSGDEADQEQKSPYEGLTIPEVWLKVLLN